MTQHDDRPVVAPDEEDQTVELAVETNGSKSLMERLRSQRAAIGRERRLDLPIPGYDGLVARYKKVSWDETKKIAEKVDKSKSPRRELMGHADYLVAACDTILVHDGEQLRPIHEVFADMLDDDEPVKFDHRLAKILGIEGDVDSARKVCLAVFNNPMAVTAQHNEVGQWNQASQTEDDEDF